MATKHTHTQKTHTRVLYLYLLQSMAGGQSCEGAREVPDFTLVVAVFSSLWEKTHPPDQSHAKITLMSSRGALSFTRSPPTIHVC